MREATRTLDGVSDHLGEVLRHADELLADWAKFGAQVRAQVEREAGAIGEVVESAVARTASTSLDRALADRLATLATELGRLEQRVRSASRAVAERQQLDRRALWIIAAGVILANILLVVLWLRIPSPLPPEPVHVDQPVVAAPAPAAVIDAGVAPPPVDGSAIDAKPVDSKKVELAHPPAVTVPSPARGAAPVHKKPS